MRKALLHHVEKRGKFGLRRERLFGRRGIVVHLLRLAECENGALDHPVVRLLRGEHLQQIPGRFQREHEHGIRLGQQAKDLIRDRRHDGQERDLDEEGNEEIQPADARHARKPEQPVGERKHENGDDEHQKDERRAAPVVQAGRLFHVLHGQLVAVFVAVDGLMFRPVIAVRLPQGGEQERKQDIQEKNDEAEAALDEVVPDAVRTADGGRRVRNERGKVVGQEEKEHDGERNAQHGGNGGNDLADGDLPVFRHPLGELGGFFIVRHGNFRAAQKGAHAQHEGRDKTHHPPHKGKAQPLFALFRRRDAFCLYLRFTVVVAHDGRHAALGAHHDALDHGLSADIGALCLLSHRSPGLPLLPAHAARPRGRTKSARISRAPRMISDIDKTAPPVRSCSIAASDPVSFLELIDASAGIDELLASRKEGMAFAANIHLHHVHVLRGARLERLAAGADDRHLMIFGMNVRLHSSFTSLIMENTIAIIPVFPAFVN